MSDPYTNRLRKSLNSWEVKSNLSKTIIEKSQLLFKKHTKKSIKIYDFIENIGLSFDETEINGRSLNIDTSFFNDYIYKDLEIIYKETFPDDTDNI